MPNDRRSAQLASITRRVRVLDATGHSYKLACRAARVNSVARAVASIFARALPSRTCRCPLIIPDVAHLIPTRRPAAATPCPPRTNTEVYRNLPPTTDAISQLCVNNLLCSSLDTS